jgi:hypothetical protein
MDTLFSMAAAAFVSSLGFSLYFSAISYALKMVVLLTIRIGKP